MVFPDDGPIYDLVGVMHNTAGGDSTIRSHYIAFLKKSDSWLEFNDSLVRRVSKEEVTDEYKSRIYLVMYRKR
jgi:ubiquitin C-terminal hydrolase